MEDGWRIGRATFFGERHDGSNDGFSIHRGSCQFGHLDRNTGTGWDIAAMPDAHYEYQGSCGKCYEIGCEPMVFTDNYGESIDRMESCVDPERTVIVTIVDTCACHYPPNQWSNRRWCCGDMDHMDISIFAYEKIGRVDKGVMGIKYRPVPCPGDNPLATPPEELTVPSVIDAEAPSEQTTVEEATEKVTVGIPSVEVSPEVETPSFDPKDPSVVELPIDTMPKVENPGIPKPPSLPSSSVPEFGPSDNDAVEESVSDSKKIEEDAKTEPSFAVAVGPSVALAIIFIMVQQFI